MASSSSDDSSHAHVLDLPADLSICVLRRLEGWDLVAACTASAVWATQVAAEELWRKACEIRWPHTFGPHTEAAVRPLAMPAWLEKVSHFRAQRRTGIMAPPGPHARLVEWRAYYLEHDLFEALNVAPAFLAADELHQLHAVLERNLQLFSPLISAVATEWPHASELLGPLRHLRHLSMAHTPRPSGTTTAGSGPDMPPPPGVLLSALGALNQSAAKKLRSLRAFDASLSAASALSVAAATRLIACSVIHSAFWHASAERVSAAVIAATAAAALSSAA